MLGIPWLGRSAWPRRAAWMLSFFLLSLLIETWMHPHYAAPAAGLFFILTMQSLRYVQLWRRPRLSTQPTGPLPNRRPGRLLIAAGVVVSLFMGIGTATSYSLATRHGWHMQCARLLALLKQQGGRHLVIIHYAPKHSPHNEWVYNAADIDQSPVVWARESSEQPALLRYFDDRRVWLVDADVLANAEDLTSLDSPGIRQRPP